MLLIFCLSIRGFDKRVESQVGYSKNKQEKSMSKQVFENKNRFIGTTTGAVH